MRCAFKLYRAFEADAAENRSWLEERRKCKVRTQALTRGKSRHLEEAFDMFHEVYVEDMLEFAVVEGAAHYLAEENPDDFVIEVLGFVGRHPATAMGLDTD